jgi:prophage regulatory protein
MEFAGKGSSPTSDVTNDPTVRAVGGAVSQASSPRHRARHPKRRNVCDQRHTRSPAATRAVTAQSPPPASEVLRLSTLKAMLEVSKASIWRWVRAGWFPKPISLSPGGHAVGWLRSDIALWLEQRRAERDGRASPEHRPPISHAPPPE